MSAFFCRLGRTITILGLFAAGLSACGDATSGRLIIWHTWDDQEAEIIEEVLRDFDELHPNIDISVERRDYDTVLDEYGDAAQAGLGPDVLIGIESVFAHLLYDNDLVADLSASDVDWELFRPNTLQSVERSEGARVGVPINAYVTVMFYNRDLVTEPPTTFAELSSMSANGIKVGLPTNFFAGYWGINQDGVGVFDGDELAAGGQANIANWFTWLDEFQQTSGAVLSPDLNALVDGFGRGELGVVVADSLELALVRESLGNEALGVATLPGYPSSKPFSTVELMVVNSSSSQLEAAATLTNFMSNEAQQRKLARTDSGRAPVHRTVRLNPTLFPEVSVILSQNEAAVVPTTGQDDLINLLINDSGPIFAEVLEGLIRPEQGAAEIISAVKDGN